MAMSRGSKSMRAQREERERETNHPKNSATYISLLPPWGQNATHLFTSVEMYQHMDGGGWRIKFNDDALQPIGK